jgi:hypothetical protein
VLWEDGIRNADLTIHIQTPRTMMISLAEFNWFNISQE